MNFVLKEFCKECIPQKSRNRIWIFIWYCRSKKEQLKACGYRCLFLFHQPLSPKEVAMKDWAFGRKLNHYPYPWIDQYDKTYQAGCDENGMTSLEFGTTATNGASATFSYTGTDGYRYNPGARLYAFSKGTNGGYTATVSDDGTSTLTVPALASQNGTLVDCATYDALYGSADVDYSTGLPESLSMHHLFGMMNLHLTSSGFSTSHPVTVTLTSSAANILPGNSGTATLKADGSLNVLTGSWGTSWSAIVTPAANGVVDVYFMTWPFTSISGTLTVSCSDGSGYNYTARSITLSSFGLAAAQLKSKPLAITSTPFVLDSSKLYAWWSITPR